MKTLYLCRHAKSSWAEVGMDDHERPLNERGLRNAPFMAHQFSMRGEPLDMIVTSTATRAFSTANAFVEALGVPVDRFQQNATIYHADIAALMAVVQSLPPLAQRVMLFGHNPGFTHLLDRLCDAGITNLPTCGLVRIDMTVDDWSSITKHSGTLVWFDYPKQHPGQG